MTNILGRINLESFAKSGKFCAMEYVALARVGKIITGRFLGGLGARNRRGITLSIVGLNCVQRTAAGTLYSWVSIDFIQAAETWPLVMVVIELLIHLNYL